MNSSPIDRPTPIRELPAPNAEEFREEILPSEQPAVLRGIADDWPLVAAGRVGPGRVAELLAKNATAAEARFLRADPNVEGRFHYGDDARSMNFIHGRGNLPGLIAALREQEDAEQPYAMAAQSLLADQFVNGFSKAHPMPLVPSSAEPRLWIGNAAKVATHRDSYENVAVVAAGRRRFTLFPPAAEPFLYMGPSDPTPGGTPVSMVHLTAPDLDRFPLFANVLPMAMEAELSPGDAIFIPMGWFHHVEALERFNVLVNYWWNQAAPVTD
jgi:hypothetical protein